MAGEALEMVRSTEGSDELASEALAALAAYLAGALGALLGGVLGQLRVVLVLGELLRVRHGAGRGLGAIVWGEALRARGGIGGGERIGLLAGEGAIAAGILVHRGRTLGGIVHGRQRQRAEGGMRGGRASGRREVGGGKCAVGVGGGGAGVGVGVGVGEGGGEGEGWGEAGLGSTREPTRGRATGQEGRAV